MTEKPTDDLQVKLDNLPRSPGVYQFKNNDGSIIYVGKAKNLRNRVRSYFQEKGNDDPKRDILVSKIADVELVVTDSEVEALLLENNLIKEHNPRYNIRLKDDKSYPYIVVTHEEFPRVFPTRRMVRDGSRYYGPYTDVKAMHLMLRTIRGIFPIRSCDYRLDAEGIAARRVKLCLDYHIKKCQGPCEGLVDGESYRGMIAQVEQLLKGKTRALQKQLEGDMEKQAEALEFERAAEIRNRLQALNTYQEKQKVASSDFKDRDIIALEKDAGDAVGVVFRVRDGKIVGKQHFPFTGAEIEREEEILEHLLHRYYSKTLDIPPEVVLPLALDSSEALQQWLGERSQIKVAFTVPRIGDKLKLLNMCRANAGYLLKDIKLQRLKAADTLPKAIALLQEQLHLPEPPRRIECFDISHHQGSETVASMVSFLDGKPRKSEYRKFTIRTVEGVDDFASMREVIERRYTRLLDEGQSLPDLIVIDGGKGQLSSAVEVLQALGLHRQSVIGLAKRLEEVYVPGESLPMNLPKTSPGLKLLQRLRDEAHRFAITFHREKHQKATLQSELEAIDGVGPKRAQTLLTTFGSVKAVTAATPEQLAEAVGWSTARAIREYFTRDAVDDEPVPSAHEHSGNAPTPSNPDSENITKDTP